MAGKELLKTLIQGNKLIPILAFNLMVNFMPKEPILIDESYQLELTLSCMMLKNDQTYLKNLSMWDLLKYVWPFFIIMHERINKNIKCLTYESLRESCPYFEFFWAAFSLIWSKYGEILKRKYRPEKVRIRTLLTQWVIPSLQSKNIKSLIQK